MIYSEAYKALGFALANQRQHWSADSDTGVCISIWRAETRYAKETKTTWCDTREVAGPLEDWKDKTGNQKRIEHIKRALDEFEGFVDAVIVGGIPGEKFGDADPWLSAKRGARWQVTFLDPETGHFAANTVAL
jgi:hypothetical protein